MHQPYRVKHYSIFSVDHDHDYWTDKDWYSGSNNERIFKKVAEKSYRPMLKQLGKLIETTDKFKFSLSMTGTFLEQAEEWAPDIIDSIRKLVKTGRVEIVNETYNHSLSFFVDRDEFEAEVRLHQDRVRELFGVETKVFRNTELAYNNDLAQWAESFGFKGIIAEGWDKILETRTPNKVYRPDGCNSIKLLTKNYRLSDDIAFRFSNKTWNEWPLTVDKYMRWLETAGNQGPVINLFMDFETFGENVWKDTGIFEFFNDLVLRWSNDGNHNFMTVSEACDSSTSEETISMPWTVTWADTERDLSAWLGNSMQHEALKAIYDLKESVLASKDEDLIADWRRLLTSDHLYYMSTKHLNDGGVHQYFSPYDSPFDAFLYFMNAVRDVRGRAEEYKNPKTKKKVKEITE
jgi:alpha-amylase